MKRILVTLFAVSLAVAGCGGSGGEPQAIPSYGYVGEVTPPPDWATEAPSAPDSAPPAQLVDAPPELLAAPDAVADAGSSRFSMVSTTQGGGQTFTFTGEGHGDYTSRTFTFSMDLGAQAGTAETRQVGDVVYLRMDAFAALLPDGVSWISMDLDAVSQELGIDLAQLADVGRNGDPTYTLELLRGMSDRVELVGEETIREVATTHYRATVDMQRALANVSADLRDQLLDVVEAAGLPDRYPVDLWVDADGLPRRMTQEMTITPPDGSGTGTQTTTIELWDYGVEVDVSPPPAGETIDLFDWVEQQQGGSA